MRKKKIVAVLLAAAMTATSFLPSGGFFQPVKAQAALLTGQGDNAVDTKNGDNLFFGEGKNGAAITGQAFYKNANDRVVTNGSVKDGYLILDGDNVKAVTFQALMVTPSGLKVGSLAGLEKSPKETAGLTKGNLKITWSSSKDAYSVSNGGLTKENAYVLTNGAVASLSAITGSVIADANSYGDANLDVTLSTGDSLSFKGSFPIRVVTNKVSLAALNGDDITFSNNRLTFNGVKFIYGTNTEIDSKYVSGNGLSFKWYKVQTASGFQTSAGAISPSIFINQLNAKTVTEYAIEEASRSAIDAKTSISLPIKETERNQYYCLVVSATSLNVASAAETVSMMVFNVGKPTSFILKNDPPAQNPNNTNPATPAKDDKSNTNNNSTTTEKTNQDGSKEKTTETKNADGSTTTDNVVTNPDGSTVETVKTVATDGTVTEKVTEKDANGNITKESEKVTNKDGSSKETTTENKADGSVTKTETTTTAAGDKTSKAVTTYPAGSAVKTETTESDIKKNGDSVIVVTKENTDGTVEISKDTKDSAGETEVVYEAAAGSSNVTVSEITTTAKKVTIPAKVTANGKAYKVTKLGAKALKGNKTATTVVVGKNIKNIGKQAFQNASKLKTINIKGNVTTIGKNSFKGIQKKATIKIKATAKQYKAMVKKIKAAGGAPAKVTYKRVK